MDLIDIISRSNPPEPWQEGDNIPWNDPGFSARMLKEHLSQAHDAASRRSDKIDQHVAWIHDAVLNGHPTTIVDLGCGPGLYSSRLAALGHTCTGIDFGPASLAYAIEQATARRLACTYRLQDLRAADYGVGAGLVMLIFGELNVFRREDAVRILTRAWDALDEDGALLLEPHTYACVHQIGKRPPTWYATDGGLFAETPHLFLAENFWDSEINAATTRYMIVDLASGAVTSHAQSFQAYTEADYAALLAECGFGEITFFPSLTGTVDPSQDGLMVIVARKNRV